MATTMIYRLALLVSALVSISLVSAKPFEQFKVRGGAARGGLDNLAILQDLGATTTRLYGMWKTMQPRVSNLNFSLTVQQVKDHPELVTQWASSPDVSWTFMDKQVYGYKNASFIVILEIGEGSFYGLPIYTPANKVADPNIIGKQTYLAYQYLVCRAVVQRHHQVVDLWQIENELNEAWLASIQGQRLFNISGYWKDWDFLTELLTTLRDSVKDVDDNAPVTMNLHTDISSAVHSFLKLPGFYLDALKAWDSLLDIHSIDAYPCYFSPNATLASKVGDRITAIRKILQPKYLIVMESGFPVLGPAQAHNTSLPPEVRFDEQAQADYMTDMYNSIMTSGGQGLLVFGTWTSPGIAPPGGYFTPMDIEAFRYIADAYLYDKILPLVGWISNPAHWDYLTNRLPSIVGQIEQGWGILASDGSKRAAYATLKALFSQQ